MKNLVKMEMVGRYRVYLWGAQQPQGISGWVVVAPSPHGGVGEVISKHKTKSAALHAAKTYVAADKRRERVS